MTQSVKGLFTHAGREMEYKMSQTLSETFPPNVL